MALPIYELIIEEDTESKSEVNTIALVPQPASDSLFLMFEEEQELKFEADEEAKEIIGAAMVPDVIMNRKGGYKCFFSKDTIKKISQKFFEKGYQKNIRLTHQGDITDGVIYQSFIVDSDKGIYSPKNLNLPDGSWVIGVKVNNDNAWEAVKGGNFKGFSPEGFFKLKDNSKDEELKFSLQKIKELNKKIQNQK